MKYSLRSVLSLLLCTVMLLTTVLTSCTDGSDVGGDTADTVESRQNGDEESQQKQEAVSADGVTLNKAELSLFQGESDKLVAAVLPDDATDKSVTWTSSNEKLVSVSQDGTVTAVGVGEADVTASTANGKSVVCHVTVKENGIDFKTLTVDENIVYGTVPNAVGEFSFINEISVRGNASYIVCLDIYGMQSVITKTVPLNYGDNVFYILQSVGDDVALYTVTIRRRPTYTVSFNTAGGTPAVASQTVEEGSLASVPTDTVERRGYTFAGWDYDFNTPIERNITLSARWSNNPYLVTYNANGGTVSNPIADVTYKTEYTLAAPTRTGYTFAGWYHGETLVPLSGIWNIAESVTLTARWTANSNTAYKVEHYVLGLDGKYELKDTDNLTGTSDSRVTPDVKSYTGFTAPETQTVTVLPDGSQVVKYYYTGSGYVVTYNANGGAVSNSLADVAYRTAYTLVTPTRAGYTFTGWYHGETLIPLSGIWNIAESITLTSGWTANSDTAYKVEHYIEALDGTYELKDTDNLTGTSDSKVTPDVKSYTGFTSPEAQTVTVLPDGSQVVKYYYTRNSYTVTYVTNGGKQLEPQILKYGAALPTASRSGFTFGGFYGDVKLTVRVEAVPAQAVTVYARWLEESSITDFEYDEADTITVTGYTSDDVNVSIPSYVGGKAVTAVAADAFKNCTAITSVIIPNTVTSVGKGAFSGCSSLESITLPFVGGSASATSASSITLFGYIFGTTSYTGGVSTKQYYSRLAGNPYNYYYIPSSLKSVTITGGTVLYGAFYGCENLTSITIGNGVTSIGGSAFYNCSSLMSVYITDVTKWCQIDFYDSTSNPLYYAKNLYLNGTLVTELSIPDGVTSIGDYAFYGCTGLTSVTIPDSVTSIGSCAFYGCKGLTSVTIGNGVKRIGASAFNGCTGLMSITIPDGVTSIGSHTFQDCTGLMSVTIPDSVTSIGEYAFWCCSSLKSITIPNGVTSIGASAFSDCTGLMSITIPDGVTSIGSHTFQDCTGLMSVTIPDSVTSIGNYAFYRCKQLKSITIPDSVTSIGVYAFNHCERLMNITIPDGVTSIGSHTFQNCTGLTSITIPDSVMSIGEYAFWCCSSLKSITIPDGVTSIGHSAFIACTGLTSITIPDGVTSIGKSALQNCTGLTSITIPDTVTSIGEGAFANCRGVTSITIPNSVTSIDDSVFYGCTGLTSIAIPDSVTSIGDYAFYGCTGLTSVTIPNSVTSIGDYAFYGCTKLVEVINKSSLNITAGSSSYGYVGYYAILCKGGAQMRK